MIFMEKLGALLSNFSAEQYILLCLSIFDAYRNHFTQPLRLPEGRQVTVLHRDIKPANVMVMKDDRCPFGFRINFVDFGLATFQEDVPLQTERVGAPLFEDRAIIM